MLERLQWLTNLFNKWPLLKDLCNLIGDCVGLGLCEKQTFSSGSDDYMNLNGEIDGFWYLEFKLRSKIVESSIASIEVSSKFPEFLINVCNVYFKFSTIFLRIYSIVAAYE